MSHVTRLKKGWIAIHDSVPDAESIITLRKIDEDGMAIGDDIDLPYEIMFDFVAEQVRSAKISRLENADVSEVFDL
jgi:hypothetical protein